ncbi:MAG: hypothetical protein C0605_01145 [Hyphomicrobiales bacterium]|nr:MAG: hypothetical protein C0605_01145 [Hyphomicrobiales bacterium]
MADLPDKERPDPKGVTARPEADPSASGHVLFRKCAACGSSDMAPETDFADSGAAGITDRGQIYLCPDCGARAPIRQPEAVFAGAVLSLFWAAIGYWAFTQGPLWYGRHFPIFIDKGFDLYLLMDAGALLFYTLLLALSGWMIWQDLVQPVLIRLGHPASRESRTLTPGEQAHRRGSRRGAVLDFFVYSLLAWAPLIGLMLLLEWFGVDLHGEAGQFIMMALAFGGIMTLGRLRPLIFFGMVLWLAVFVAIVFWAG